MPPTAHTPTANDLRNDAEAAYRLARAAFDKVHAEGLRMYSPDECAAAAGALAATVHTLHTLRADSR